MPQYEYTCAECNHTATKLRKMDDRDEPLECGECGSTMIRVVALTGSPSFKGGGWTPKHY